jgi:glycosyltransferase involved in cell wall biosynthesis
VLNNLCLSTYLNFEVLVGDHGSTDNTYELASGYYGMTVRTFKIPYQDPPCRNEVRNVLLNEARGDIVIFIDADVLVPRDFIETYVRLHQQHTMPVVLAGAVYGKNFINDENLKQLLPKINLNNISESQKFIEETPLLNDPRLTILQKKLANAPTVYVESENVPWHMFWGCNLSFRKENLVNVGGFSTDFKGWGCEDNEIAERLFHTYKTSLIFTKEAWGFHVPHKMDVVGNLLFWQKNAQTLLNKYPNRATEYFKMDGLHGCELNSTITRIEAAIDNLKQAPGLNNTFTYNTFDRGYDYLTSTLYRFGKHLPTNKVLWLGYMDELTTLGVNKVLCPFVNMNYLDKPRYASLLRIGSIVYSLLGTATHFQNLEIDESLVMIDRLMLLEPHLRTLILKEMHRTSKTITVLYGSLAKEPRFQDVLNEVEQLIINGLK